jgi:hypothetical protein
MFRAIRSWWRGGRGKVTARLFLFELCVVVLGVLIAQGLANFAQRQSDYANMEEERSRALYELESAHQVVRAWSAAVPCLNARMDEVIDGRPLSAGDLRRPALSQPRFSPQDPATLSLIAERHGVDEKNHFQALTDNLESLRSRSEAMVSLWGRLMLVSPTNGQATPEDRAQARLAAADIKAQLHAIEITSGFALRRFPQLNVPAQNNLEPGTGPARSCTAIWRSGRIDPPLTME